MGTYNHPKTHKHPKKFGAVFPRSPQSPSEGARRTALHRTARVCWMALAVRCQRRYGRSGLRALPSRRGDWDLCSRCIPTVGTDFEGTARGFLRPLATWEPLALLLPRAPTPWGLSHPWTRGEGWGSHVSSRRGTAPQPPLLSLPPLTLSSPLVEEHRDGKVTAGVYPSGTDVFLSAPAARCRRRSEGAVSAGEGGRSRYPRTTSCASRSRPGGTYGTFRPGEEGLSVCLCVRLSKHTS